MNQNRYPEMLFSMGKMAYWKAPPFLRVPFSFVESFARVAHHLKLDSWFLSGEESASKDRLTIHYTGSEKNKNYLAGLAFSPGYREVYLGKRWLWQSLRDIRGNETPADLHVAETHCKFWKLYHRRDCICIPSWMNGDIPIPDDITDFMLKQSSLRRNYQRFSKMDFYPEVTHEMSRIRRFYNEMHVPYVRNTYGNEAQIVNFNTMKSKAGKLELVVVKIGKEEIAGGLISYKDNQATFLIVGIQGGYYEYVREGVLSALYYFIFSHLQSKGFKSVHMGTSRAFLEDGVLNAKRKWNYRITHSSMTLMMLKIPAFSNGAISFLMNHPFIRRVDNRYICSLFTGQKPLSPDEMRKIYRLNYVEGTCGVEVFRIGGGNTGGENPLSTQAIPPDMAGRFTIMPVTRPSQIVHARPQLVPG